MNISYKMKSAIICTDYKQWHNSLGTTQLRPKMKYYRIVFARNEVISCSEAKDIPESDNLIEHQNGHMIFALVKASSEADATEIGRSLAKQVTQTHKMDDNEGT